MRRTEVTHRTTKAGDYISRINFGSVGEEKAKSVLKKLERGKSVWSFEVLKIDNIWPQSHIMKKKLNKKI